MDTPPPESIAFRRLPLVVRIATMLTLFMTWLMFAELVIDRHGLDVYLPYYRVGAPCPYDLAVIALLVFYWIRLHRRGKVAAGSE
jgi:hypothetical protein